MNILVTGGAGFIGSTVVDAYVESGHRVWVIDNETSGRRKQVNSKASYKKMDVRNRAALATLFSRVRFDVVNHHAAQIDVRKSVADPVYDADVNIMGLLNVLQLCVRRRVKKIMFSSSGGTVYGECARPAREGDAEVPLSPYGVAKLASEKYIKAFSSLYGLRHTIFRYANVYGPRQDPHGEAGVVAIFSQRLLGQQRPAIFGKGLQTRDYVYVGDVARANVLALHKAHNEILNIGTQKETSVIDLLKKIAAVADVRSKPLFRPARAGELQRSVLNISYTKKTLAWVPQVSLEAGLGKTYRYFSSSLIG